MNRRSTAFGTSHTQDSDLFAQELFGSSRWPGPVEIDEDQEDVRGTDDRVQVLARSTNPSTTLFPFNTICFMDQGGGVNATGTLIAPRVVITAGHVVKGLSTVGVTPGMNLGATAAADRRPATPTTQTSGDFAFHSSLDLALVFLPVAFTKPARFMMLQPRGDLNTATLLTIAGYPRVSKAVVGTMWRHSDRLKLSGVSATHLDYQIDTTEGQSGSPLWLLGNDEIRLLLGVHIGAKSAENTGVRITCAVIDWIESECKSRSVKPLPIVDNVQRRRVCP